MLKSKKNFFLGTETYINFQNSTAEIFFAYLFGILSLILAYFTAPVDLTEIYEFNEARPIFSTAIIAIFPLFILITFLTFYGEKITQKILPHHSNRLLLNTIQILGIPAILSAWFFYIYYIILENYKNISIKGIAMSFDSLINYVLFIYLIFFSIKFFSVVSIGTKDNTEAKQVVLRPGVLIFSIFVALITFYKNVDNPGLAYAQSFLIAGFIFRITNYIYTKIADLSIIKIKNK